MKVEERRAAGEKSGGAERPRHRSGQHAGSCTSRRDSAVASFANSDGGVTAALAVTVAVVLVVATDDGDALESREPGRGAGLNPSISAIATFTSRQVTSSSMTSTSSDPGIPINFDGVRSGDEAIFLFF